MGPSYLSRRSRRRQTGAFSALRQPWGEHGCVPPQGPQQETCPHACHLTSPGCREHSLPVQRPF